MKHSESDSSQTARKPRTPSDEVRKAILKNAQRVFLEAGYEAASMREIVQASGYSKPTIYAHFGSKERLFQALVATVCRQITPPDYEIPKGLSAREVLTELVASYQQSLLQPEFVELYRLVIAEAKRFPELGEVFFQSGPVTSRKALASILEQLEKRGLLVDLGDSRLAAENFEALILEPVKLRAFLLPDASIDPEETRQQTEAAIDLFLRAFAPTTP